MFTIQFILICAIVNCIYGYKTFHFIKPSILHSKTSVNDPSTARYAIKESFGNILNSFWSKVSNQFTKKEQIEISSTDSSSSEIATKRKKNSILVFGATGRTGKEIVKQLLSDKHGNSPDSSVVVTGRNITKLHEIYDTMAMDNARLEIFFESIDITNNTHLEINKEKLFTDISQLVLTVGPTFQDAIKDNFSSERVDYLAVQSIVNNFKSYLDNSSKKASQDVSFTPIDLFHKGARNLSSWNRLDDVIMGGRSKSYWSEVNWAEEGADFCRWEGELITEGGGFCGTAKNNLNVPITENDGIKLRVRGDGRRYKFRLTVNDQFYQASFDTIENAWTDVYLPFDTFVANRQTTVDYRVPSPSALASPVIKSIGLIYSKFSFNSRSNSRSSAGPFQLDISTVEMYREPRPQVVLVSSAGTERINKLYSKEETKRDIPIVQLNPQGILNWKYMGEEAVRESGLSYAIICSCGLASVNISNTVAGPVPVAPDPLLLQSRRLEISQGGVYSGRILREELASVVLETLASPYTIGTTFDVRRDDGPNGRLVEEGHENNWGMIDGEINQRKQQYWRVFRSLTKDEDRGISTGLGKFLPPLPIANKPF